MRTPSPKKRTSNGDPIYSDLSIPPARPNDEAVGVLIVSQDTKSCWPRFCSFKPRAGKYGFPGSNSLFGTDSLKSLPAGRMLRLLLGVAWLSSSSPPAGDFWKLKSLIPRLKKLAAIPERIWKSAIGSICLRRNWRRWSRLPQIRAWSATLQLVSASLFPGQLAEVNSLCLGGNRT